MSNLFVFMADRQTMPKSIRVKDIVLLHSFFGLRYYSSDDSIRCDHDLLSMWSYMVQNMQGLPCEPTLQNLKTVFRAVIFRVSGYHQHMGNVNVAGTSAVNVGLQVKKGCLNGSIESVAATAAVSLLTAGMVAGLGYEQTPTLL